MRWEQDIEKKQWLCIRSCDRIWFKTIFMYDVKTFCQCMSVCYNLGLSLKFHDTFFKYFYFKRSLVNYYLLLKV